MTTVEEFLKSILGFLIDWSKNILTSGGAVKVSQVSDEGNDIIISSNESGTNTIPAGAKSINITTASDFSGAINGADYAGIYSINFNASTGKLLPEIAITPIAGSYILNIQL